MNQVTRDIVARFNIDAATALQVQATLEEQVYIDFSECTQRQYDEALDEAYAIEFGVDALLAVLA